MQREKLKQYLEIYRRIEGYEDVEEYLRVLERGPGRSSFEQVLSAIFEAVIEADIDPTDVDLRKFLKAYHEIIRRKKDIDYFFAGKVIFYAWEIILREARRILFSLLPQEEGSVQEEQMEVRREEAVPVVYRRESRPVTLLDLLEAAKKANEALKEKPRRRQKRNVPLIEVPPPEVTHEDLELEIRRVYEILKEKKGKISFSEISRAASDPISAFISLLFLAFEGKILLWEKEGEIFAEII